MTELQFMCKMCRQQFFCNVGEITFPPEIERPHFEKSIQCPNCGVLSMDEVELTELGQTQLAEVYFAEL